MESPVHEIVAEADIYRIYWQDAERTICGIRVLAKQWDWEDALAGIHKLDETVKSVEHGVYVIYTFNPGTNIMPRGSNLVANIRPLMNIYAPNTLFIYFVRPDPSLHVFTNIVGRIFQLTGRDYMFVDNMDEAQKMIVEHRQQNASD